MASPKQQEDDLDTVRSCSPVSEESPPIDQEWVPSDESSEDGSSGSHASANSSLEAPHISAYLNGLLRRIVIASDDPMGVYQFVEKMEALAVGEAPSIRKQKTMDNILNLPDDDGRKRPILRFYMGLFHKWFEFKSLLEDADALLCLESEMLRLLPEDDPSKPKWLEEHAGSYNERFTVSGAVEDIEQSKRYFELATSLTPDDHPEKFRLYSSLGNSYGRLFQCLGRLDDLKTGIKRLEQAASLIPDGHSHQPTLLANQGILYNNLFDHTHSTEDVEKSTSCLNKALTLISDDHEHRPLWLSSLGNIYHNLFEDSRAIENLDMAISYHEKALLLAACNPTTKPTLLTNLTRSLCRRFESTHQLNDVERSIRCLEEEVESLPDSHLEKCQLLRMLGASYKLLYRHHQNRTQIKTSISYFEKAMSLTPNKSLEKPKWLDVLGESYALLFVHEKSREAIKNWVYCSQKALPVPHDYSHNTSVQYMPAGSRQFFLKCFEATKDNESVFDYKTQVALLGSENDSRPFFWLYQLGVWYEKSFDSSGKVEDLRKSVDLLEQYDLLTLDGHLDKSKALSTLGGAYQTLFERLGELKNINKSIGLQERSLDLLNKDYGDHTGLLSGLGAAYYSRFEYRHDMKDLEKSLHYQEQAFRMTSTNHPSNAWRLASLGPLYLSMFSQLGETTNLQKSIDCLKQALKLVNDNNPQLKASCLTNLGCSYGSAYEHLGQLTDLEDSISCLEQAISLTPDEDLAKPARSSNLGNSYRLLYYRLGRLEDLDMGTKYQKNALLLAPDDHPKKPEWLASLGNSYLELFERLGRIKDLETATHHYETVVNSTPDDHSSKASWYNGLGKSHEYRYEQWHQLEDIKKSLKYHQQAVRLVRSGKLDKSVYLSSLGDAYKSLFEHLGNSESIDKAIEYYEQALELVPDGHMYQVGRLKSLAVSYRCRFDRLKRFEDAEKSRDYFKQATRVSRGDSLIKLVSGKGWVWFCFELDESPLEAYTYTMELVPEVAWLGSSIASRYERLSLDIGQLATEAAAAACSRSKFDLALEWLEAGRGVVWGQMLNLRTPLDDLAVVDQGLADQLRQVSLSLQQINTPSITSGQTFTQTLAMGSEDQKYRRLADSWDQLLAKVRSISGFQSFLRPKRFGELSMTAVSSTVIVINLHADFCDAVALMKDSLTTIHVPLPKFSHHKAMELREKLMRTLNSGHIRTRSKRQPVYFADHIEEQFHDILSILWTDIVSPILNAIGYLQSTPPGDELPHVTWCTIGPLAFLPIHAAMSRDGEGGVLDYVVSSYTPTLSTLLKPGPKALSACHILAVGQASSAGSVPLPGTIIELDYIRENSNRVPITRLEGNNATIDAVLSGMEGCNWVHLACHASQNISDPNKSSFQLHGGELSLARITQKSLLHADFAFLSACETAAGDEKLPDEAVHLAAGMLMVGYSGVIATMWSVQDEDAPLVAEKVYARMFGGGVPDSKRAARALHEAVHSLREIVGSKDLRRWAPYIHMGL